MLGTRDHDTAALAEYESVRRNAGLTPDSLRHIRVESAPLPHLDLDDYSGIILGGSPFNVSDDVKSPLQQRVEGELSALVNRAVDVDFPFLGLCYGVGIVTTHLGGTVDNAHAEAVGAADITQTDAGRTDPLLAGVSPVFKAFVGHKEACSQMPPGAVQLATGTVCPVQMYRVKTSVYVTQFHPELDVEDLAARMRIYAHAGYFRPEELEDLIAMARLSGVTGEQHLILTNFVNRFARA